MSAYIALRFELSPLTVFSTGTTTIPIDIGRDDARSAAENELSKVEYHAAEPSLLEKITTWISELIDKFFTVAVDVVPGGAFGLLVVLLLAIAIVVAIRLRLGKFGRQHRRTEPVFINQKMSAADYRDSAEKAYLSGDISVAVRDRFRAIVRILEERGFLDERGGRTATEVACELASALPELATDLAAAATLFNDVYYGGHSASDDDYRRLSELDKKCQSSSPVVGAPQ